MLPKEKHVDRKPSVEEDRDMTVPEEEVAQ